uniref:C2 domain-containing protein n=1 Tax=Leersia perrieri TaxID=77586 RepID=A0A0D9XXJ0_9ORYZ
MMQRPFRPEDYSLMEASPHLGGGAAGYDLVEQMQYLYVRVVKAKDIPSKDITGSCDPYVGVKLGNYMGITRSFENTTNPEWNLVFAFSKEHIQSSVVEIIVKDKAFVEDDFIGQVLFELNEIPKRVPPDRPLAQQWYPLEERNGHKVKGELMLAVWVGTQADEAFNEAWHSDAASIPAEGLASIRSKVYLTPKLWYLRVNVIEAQDLIPSDRTRFPKVYVKAILGNQALRTRVSSPSRTLNPIWNEDLMFVAAEPFDEHLILSVEDRIAPGKDDVLGRTVVSLQHVLRRLDHKLLPNCQWYRLEKHLFVDGVQKKETESPSRIRLRICLEGGYHVFDESTHYSSDLRPTAEQLWKHSIGILELGILTARGLLPMKMRDKRGTTDAYCVAKYGQKWVRTRTIIDSFTPRWNEQYTWDVYDPCTVITIGVFDNCHLNGWENGARDSRIGKVRIPLSTLETDRVYTHAYPLIVLTPAGVKKMGEVQLAVRFTMSSLLNMMHLYSQPLLPKMHYVRPLSVVRQDNLRHRATMIVSKRLCLAEPPLRKEIVEYMLDVDSQMWSIRKSKANLFRVLSTLMPVAKWFDHISHWRNPLTTIVIHILFVILVLYPELILPTIFLFLFLIGVWHYRRRPRHPPHINIRISFAEPESAHPDELDEEFDTFPTSRPPDIVRMRYDRLRTVAGRIQTVVGDFATQGERLQSLLNWRDPRATALFATFCFIGAIVLCVAPFRLVVLLAGLYTQGSATIRPLFLSTSSGGSQQELIACCKLDRPLLYTMPSSR